MAWRKKSSRSRAALASPESFRGATPNKPNWTILHNKLPPTQLRELDLLGSHRFDGHGPPQQQAGSSSSHSSFREEVFSRVAAVAGVVDPGRGQRPRLQRMRWTGQIFWLLAYVPIPVEITFSPPSPPNFEDWPIGKSYPVTAAQLLPIRTGFLAPIHFSKLAKNWIEK